jgi:hypothetical protein
VIPPNNFPVQYKGRGSDGRLPFYNQADLYIQHEVKFGGKMRLVLSANVINALDSKTATNYFATELASGQGVNFTEQAFYTGQVNIANLITNIPKDPRFLQNSSRARAIRLGAAVLLVPQSGARLRNAAFLSRTGEPSTAPLFLSVFWEDRPVRRAGLQPTPRRWADAGRPGPADEPYRSTDYGHPVSFGRVDLAETADSTAWPAPRRGDAKKVGFRPLAGRDKERLAEAKRASMPRARVSLEGFANGRGAHIVVMLETPVAGSSRPDIARICAMGGCVVWNHRDSSGAWS